MTSTAGVPLPEWIVPPNSDRGDRSTTLARRAVAGRMPVALGELSRELTCEIWVPRRVPRTHPLEARAFVNAVGAINHEPFSY